MGIKTTLKAKSFRKELRMICLLSYNCRNSMILDASVLKKLLDSVCIVACGIREVLSYTSKEIIMCWSYLRFYISSLLYYVVIGCALGYYGGHELFSSLYQLETLWRKEIKMINIIEKIINESKRGHIPLERYV